MNDHESGTAFDDRAPATISGVAVLARVTRTLLVSFFILGFALSFLAQRARPENLPMFRGGTAHSGVYEAPGVPKLSKVKWTFHAKGQLISSPAVAADTIYVGSTAGILYAVDRVSGTERWKFETKSRITSSPAVADGLVFFG